MEARNAKGDSSAQVGHRDTVLREGNESQTQAYGVRVFLPRGSFYCFVPVATQPAVPFSLKNPVGWPDGPPDESGEMEAVFPEINRIWTPLYHFCHCFQYLASVNTNFLDRLDQSGVTCCN